MSPSFVRFVRTNNFVDKVAEKYIVVIICKCKDKSVIELGCNNEFGQIKVVIFMECKIREWCLEDAADLAEMLNNKNIMNNLRDGLPYPYTKKDAEEYITAMLAADKTKTFAFAITVNDRCVGSIGVFRCENIHFRTAEMGYYIGEPYWGKGIGTSAVKQVCSYIFEHTDIIRIFAEPFAYNTASCRVLEKAGFHFEGVLRSNAVKNGKVIDMKMYSLIRETGEM